MAKATVENLKVYIQDELQKSPIRERLDRFIQDGSSKAGTRYEEVFTREFLCPVIGRFFYEYVRSELNMSDGEIKAGLGTEGFTNCPGFAFTPAHRSSHFLQRQISSSQVRPTGGLLPTKRHYQLFKLVLISPFLSRYLSQSSAKQNTSRTGPQRRP